MTQHDFTQTIFGEPAPPPRRRRDRHHRPPHRGHRRWLVLLLAVVLVGGAAYAAYSVLSPMVSGLFTQSEAEDFAGPGEGQVEVVVEPGQTGEDIATTLRDAGVVKSRSSYLEVATSDPKRAAAIQPGTYVLLKGMPAQEAFDTLADPANRDVNRTTVREGLWASETYALLSKADRHPGQGVRQGRQGHRGDRPAQGGRRQGRGLAFPRRATSSPRRPPPRSSSRRWWPRRSRCSTSAGVAAKDRQKRAHPGLARRGRGRTLDVDRPKIARVVPEPLETDGAPAYGLLQSDAAVLVTAPSAERSSRARPSSTTRTTPTTPASSRACRRGRSATRARPRSTAAANPADGPWFFFVAVNPITGETKYAATLDEHDRQRRRAERLLQGQTAGLRSVRAAVLGSPIAHSLSPALHRAGYARRRADRLGVRRARGRADGLAAFVGGPRTRSGAGCR